jgi:uncharacterized protein (DUF2062 family)
VWQRKVAYPIVAQLTQGLTPHKIALTIAVGSAIAMFPILGTTTVLCLLVGIVMRLNQPIVQAVNYLWTPLHVFFIGFSLRWGERLFAVRHTRLEWRHLRTLLPENWTQVIQEPGVVLHNLIQLIRDYSGTAFHAVVVWAILAPFWATAIYYVALPILRGIDKVRLDAAAKVAAEKAKNHPVP